MGHSPCLWRGGRFRCPYPGIIECPLTGYSIRGDEIERDLAQHSQIARGGAITHPAIVLAEGDIQDPMEPIFYGPMPADRLDQHHRIIAAA
jgi:hypothetical protein